MIRLLSYSLSLRLLAIFLILVQFLQAVLGYTALHAATGLLPMAVMMMPLSTIAPTIAHKVGYRRTVVTGMLTVAAGLTLLALLADANRGYLSILPGLLVIGAGVGLAMSPATTAITSSLTEDKQGVASALNDTVREIGAAMGLALIGSILNSRFRTNITDLANTYPPATAARIKEGIGGALSTAAQLGPDGQSLVTAARNAYVDGTRPALLIAASLAVIAAAYTAWTGLRERQSTRA